MSTIKSSTEHLTLNADGSGKDIKFQANGVEKASISSAGAFTSTSIDATKLSGALPAIDGSALTGMPAGGKVLQVLQTIKTDTFSTSARNDNPASITGLSVTITPSSTSSKILVMFNIGMIGNSSGNSEALTLRRNSTDISIGDASGNRRRASITSADNDSGHAGYSVGHQYLDSPSTTAATTYGVTIGGNGSVTMHINRSNRDINDTFNDNRSVSTITVMEIGA